MAAPALFWWQMPLKMSQQDGVQRAHAALANTATGKITKNASSATLVSGNFIATISCLPRGKSEVQVIIIMAGQDGKETRGVLEQLRGGMRTGLFE